MAHGRKRSRCSNWSHEETLLLAELKREAFLNKEEGRLIWERIAETISIRFPDQIRSHDHCRRRWDTLKKDYNHIEEYCVVTGQDHGQLDEDELRSMQLDTAYRQDWYNKVKQVCSQHKRKEREDCDLVAAELSKRLNTGSHSSVFPECTPAIDALITTNSPARRDTLFATPSVLISEPVITTRETHHERSTTGNAQFPTWPSVDFEMLRLEEENQRLKRELALLRQREQVTQHDQVLQPFSNEVRSEVKEPSLQDAVLDCPDTTVLQPLPAEVRSEAKEPLQDVVLDWSDVGVPLMFLAEVRSEVKECLQDAALDCPDTIVLQPFPAELRSEVKEPLQDAVLDCPIANVLQPFPVEVRPEGKEPLQVVVLDCANAMVLQLFPAEVRSEVKEPLQADVLDWSDVMIPQMFLAEVKSQVKEPLKDVVLDWRDVLVEPSSKVEQDDRDSELIGPSSRSLQFECSSHGEGLGAMNSAGCNGYDVFVTFTCFSPPLSFTAREYHEYHSSGATTSNFGRTKEVWTTYEGKRRQIKPFGIREPKGPAKGNKVEIRPPNSKTKIWVGTFETRLKAMRAFDAAVYLIGKEPYYHFYPGNYFPRRPTLSNFARLRTIIQAEAKKYAEKNGPRRVNPFSLFLDTSYVPTHPPKSYDVVP